MVEVSVLEVKQQNNVFNSKCSTRITDKIDEVIKGKNLEPANSSLAGNIKNDF
ncbi:MAG: hypothetical protein CM15mV49_040 [uncultured marine virus]|nr:MAG: hypothetical protein CM15mV49_040 [uncultured marine virus]